LGHWIALLELYFQLDSSCDTQLQWGIFGLAYLGALLYIFGILDSYNYWTCRLWTWPLLLLLLSWDATWIWDFALWPMGMSSLGGIVWLSLANFLYLRLGLLLGTCLRLIMRHSRLDLGPLGIINWILIGFWISLTKISWASLGTLKRLTLYSIMDLGTLDYIIGLYLTLELGLLGFSAMDYTWSKLAEAIPWTISFLLGLGTYLLSNIMI